MVKVIDLSTGTRLPLVKKSKNKKKGTMILKRPSPALQRMREFGTVSVPAAIGTIQGSKTSMPQMIQYGGSCVVKNFEYVGAFPSATGNFDIDGFITNPGIASSFPWCSGIALNFQKFRIKFLRYIYSGSCPTSTVGKVYLSLSYSLFDTAPNSLARVMASETSSTGPAWFGGTVNVDKAFGRLSADADIYVDVDTSKLTQPFYYVAKSTTQSSGGSLTGTATGGNGTLAYVQGTVQDPTRFPVQVYAGNNGVTSSTVPGELYVAYILEFFEPIATADKS